MKNLKKQKKIYNRKLAILYLILPLLLISVNLFGQESNEEINNTLWARFSVPMLQQTTLLVHPIKGKDLQDKFTEYPESKDRFDVEIKNAKVNMFQNSFSGQYIGIFGEEINFSGTLSNDKKMILKLGVNYSLIQEYPNATYKTIGRFYIYNLPLIKGFAAINPPDNSIFMYTAKYNKEKTTIEAETYSYYQHNKGNYSEETRITKLIATDEEYYKTTLPWWNISLKTSDSNQNNGIAIKGNSTSYAGYIIAELMKKTEVQIIDQTNETNELRNVEALMKDICLPDHRDFAISTEESLKYPMECKTTVAINEIHDVANQTIDTQITIISPKTKKELKYSLTFGNSKEDLVKCDQVLFSQVDEIVNTIMQLND